MGKQDRTFHGALLDSEILAEVYLAMTGGQVTLAIEEDTQTDGKQTAMPVCQFGVFIARVIYGWKYNHKE